MQARGNSGVRRSSRMPTVRDALEELRSKQSDGLLIGSDFKKKEADRRARLDRSMMTDEEQLASPADAAVEDEFTPYAGAMGQVDVMPTVGALTPAQRALKAGYKGAVKAQEDLATGGFDKIKRMLRLEKLVRDPEEARAVVNTRIGNPLSHQLPVASEQVQPLMRQKALQDTRAALTQRADRGPFGSGMPQGGAYYGLEVLDDTVVKGPTLHGAYSDNWDHGDSVRRDFVDSMEIEARKRANADAVLSQANLAPESMVVRTPKGAYMVQDRAAETLEDRLKSLKQELNKKTNKIIERYVQNKISKDEYDQLRSRAVRNYERKNSKTYDDVFKLEREIKSRGLQVQDSHDRNVMFDKHNKPLTVDTQWFTDTPLPEDHWRVIRKPR